MFRTVGDQPSLRESRLPAEVLRLPAELARVDALLNDPVFFAPFAPYFHPVIGRPSTPAECYLRLMFLKFRYRLGYESLCAEGSDSISWRRFCRIPPDGKVPHPTTLMKLTARCGSAAVAGRPGNSRAWPSAPPPRQSGCWPTRAGRCAALRGRRRGRLRRAVSDLAELLDVTRQVAAQTRQRLAGAMPDGATRRGSLHDGDARAIAEGPLGRAVAVGDKGQVTDNDDGVVLDYTVEQGNPADGPQLAPAIGRVIRRTGKKPRTVTADRSYGEQLIADDLRALGASTSPSRARANPARPARPPNDAPRSAAPSNGGPAAKAASAHSNANTDGTAPASTAPKEPGPGPATGSGPTT